VLDASALSFVFFEHFREFKGIVFHMASESYDRRYIPLFAAAV
jgi:carboxypeptidase C (cathepsin A)